MKTILGVNKPQFIFLIMVALIFAASAAASQLYQNSNANKVQVSVNKENNTQEDRSNQTAATSSAEPKNEDSNSNSSSNNSGTCQVTKNGVTEIVPADQVNVNETGSGDISVKVVCDNKVESNSSTKVENKVNVKVNTSN